MLKMLAGVGCCGHLPRPSFGSVEQRLWSCSTLCHTSLKRRSVWLEHHKQSACVLGSRGLSPCCCRHSWLSLSGLSWELFLPIVSLPPKYLELAVVSLKLSVLLGQSNLN